MKMKLSKDEAKRKLKAMACTGGGSAVGNDRMLELIESVEAQYSCSDDPILLYWLGVALQNYTSWFVRGEDRISFLNKAVSHFERAHSIGKNQGSSKWHEYAGTAGQLLVEEAAIRNLDRGLTLLEEAFSSRKTYEPYMCWFADGYYKRGNYARAIEVGKELHGRASNSREWRDGIPQMPMMIVVKSYRAIIRQEKKEKNFILALEASKSLLETGAASPNDRKLHDKLNELVNA